MEKWGALPQIPPLYFLDRLTYDILEHTLDHMSPYECKYDCELSDVKQTLSFPQKAKL